MPKVTVIGSANVDFTIAVDHLPVAGETVLGQNVCQSFGGKGANQAVAAKQAGARVAFLAKLGSDSHGRAISERLLSIGLSREGLLFHPGSPTGVAFILVDAEGRNLIAVSPGSNQTLSADDVRQAAPLIAGADVLLAQLEIPFAAVMEALAIAKAHRVTTILNPAPTVPLSSDVLGLVDVLTPNEGEAARLTGLSDAAAAAHALRQQGVGCVIVTLAERGALLVEEKTARVLPAYPVRCIDSTAAGDAFNGALACAIAAGRPFDAAVAFANAAGALTTTKRGAQEALPSRHEIEQLWLRLV
jgi:ribokinase